MLIALSKLWCRDTVPHRGAVGEICLKESWSFLELPVRGGGRKAQSATFPHLKGQCIFPMLSNWWSIKLWLCLLPNSFLMSRFCVGAQRAASAPLPSAGSAILVSHSLGLYVEDWGIFVVTNKVKCLIMDGWSSLSHWFFSAQISMALSTMVSDCLTTFNVVILTTHLWGTILPLHLWELTRSFTSVDYFISAGGSLKCIIFIMARAL